MVIAELDVEYEQRRRYPDDGGVVWLAGHSVVDPETGGYLAGDGGQARSGLTMLLAPADTMQLRDRGGR